MFGKKRGRYGTPESNTVDLSPETLQKLAETVGSYAVSNATFKDGFTGEDYSVQPEDGLYAVRESDGAKIPFSAGFDPTGIFDLNEEAPVAGTPYSPGFEEDLDAVLGEVRALLLAKNASYGDSALDPIRALSSADPVEQIKVRMDDKISRLVRGNDFFPEDTLQDLVGYYFLLKIAEARNV